MNIAFFKKYRVKLIVMFSLTYPFLAVFVRSLVWWKLDPHYAGLLQSNARDMGPFPEIFIYFVPCLALFFLLPIAPRFFLMFSVVLVTFIYLVAMVWPVYFTSFDAYCMLKDVDCTHP